MGGRSSGVRFDGMCMAAVPLPGYAIDRIRSGRPVPGKGQLRRMELSVSRMSAPHRPAGDYGS